MSPLNRSKSRQTQAVGWCCLEEGSFVPKGLRKPLTEAAGARDDPG